MVVAGIAVVPAALFLSAPRWLPVEDPPGDCPALVVLNGAFPFRAEEAAWLHRADRRREVWLTEDPSSSDETGDGGTRSNARRLRQFGVPEASIRVVPGQARGTRAELQVVAAELTRRGFGCAMAITSPLHTRRVKITWRRYVGSAPRLLVRHTRDGNFIGWNKMAWELGGTVKALAGFAP
jgi:hypothetical protein